MNKRWEETGKKIIKIAGKYKYILIVIFVGIILLSWQTGDETENIELTYSTDETVDFDLEQTEQRLKNILSKINGVGEIEVMLTLESGTEQIIASDTAQNISQSDGGSIKSEEETQTVILSVGSGEEDIVVVKKIYPVFRGAIVVCSGGDNAEVKFSITKSVAAITGLGSNQITVLKMKQGGYS